MSKKTKIIIAVVVILLLGVGAYTYWYINYGVDIAKIPNPTDSTDNSFTPFNRGGRGTSTYTDGNTTGTSTDNAQTEDDGPIPTLRLLSNTPVGGYAASSTASTTVVRWIDRGRGNILETKGNELIVQTISNTVLPKIYDTAWGKGLASFIGTSFTDNNNEPDVLFSEIRKRATTTPKIATNATSTGTPGLPTDLSPYELKGKILPDNILAYVASPKRDRVLLFIKEGDLGVGYTASFDGKSLVKIFDSPLTMVNIDWPEENTIVVTTKASGTIQGYAYIVNPKTGIWKKVAGPAYGLNVKVSRDAKYLVSSQVSLSKQVSTKIINIGTTTESDSVIKTLAEKCVWGNFYKEMLYCAVPMEFKTASYPDDWYKGSVSFVDKIWQINAKTGEIKLITNIIDKSDRVIDAINLSLDEKDNFLYFMNKNDLSLWSIDLVVND